MELKETLERIAQRWSYKMTETSPGVFALDVGIKLKDGTVRYQFVYARVEEAQPGNPRIYITSTCGIYKTDLNFYDLLKETAWCNYSTITIGKRKSKEGVDTDVVMTQAAPLVAHTSPDLLDAVLFEVANMADFVEQKYFGADVN